MDAQGALDSLLGRLTAVLVDKAQLLGRVRSDVEFIKDEMESMNGLLLHLTEAQHRDHQVRAWMKQVTGLTRDCEGNVELYVHYVGGGPAGGGGLLGHLRRVVRFVRTVPVRHHIATRIQELKVRARDVGDRRQRYGVTVPPSGMSAVSSTARTHDDGDLKPADKEEDLRRRRALLADIEPPMVEVEDEVVERSIDCLVDWLSMEPSPPPRPAAATRRQDEDGEPPEPQPKISVRLFSVLGVELAGKVAMGVYQHQPIASLFDCKVWVEVHPFLKVRDKLAEILQKLIADQPGQQDDLRKESLIDDKEQLVSELHCHLKDKRFLIVITTSTHGEERRTKRLLDLLLRAADGCHPGSAIMSTSYDDQLAQSSYPYKIINCRSLQECYDSKAEKLCPTSVSTIVTDLCRSSGGAFDAKTFLHLLYVNPNRTEEELDRYRCAISEFKDLNKSISRQVLSWCYNELPIKYRSCLLYLSIFPQGHVIRAASLARRWAAEGLIAATDYSDEKQSATEEAHHYLDVLFVRGFVCPLEISAAGSIKSFTVHHQVHKFITREAKDVNFVDTNLPPDLAHHLSIHSRIWFQESHSHGDSYVISAYLPAFAASPQWQMFKVLDLEGCKGLNKKKHLKSICKILLLKYLSLRNTDVAELPEQIKELQCLEMLDIRQTKVRMLARKAIVLPLLKHFLAGHKIMGIKDSATSEDSISAVRMPLHIQKMRNMEILSHVQVSNNNELASIAQLLKLRKLGVALHGKHVKLSDLFCQIEKLHRCLRSLSIRMSWADGSANHASVEVDGALLSLPRFIESLNINGVTTGLPRLIRDQHQLAKVTLSESYFKEDDICIFGMLRGLRYLRLQHKSYSESELTLREDEFQSLMFLLVEGNDVTRIRFSIGAAPKLERIVWRFDRMEALSGIRHLPKLKNLEINGDCDLDPIRDELSSHPNLPTLNHKPHHQRQEDTTAAPASSSSAP